MALGTLDLKDNKGLLKPKKPLPEEGSAGFQGELNLYDAPDAPDAPEMGAFGGPAAPELSEVPSPPADIPPFDIDLDKAAEVGEQDLETRLDESFNQAFQKGREQPQLDIPLPPPQFDLEKGRATKFAFDAGTRAGEDVDPDAIPEEEERVIEDWREKWLWSVEDSETPFKNKETTLFALVDPTTSVSSYSLHALFPERADEFLADKQRAVLHPTTPLVNQSLEDYEIYINNPEAYTSRELDKARSELITLYEQYPGIKARAYQVGLKLRQDTLYHLQNHPDKTNSAIGYYPKDIMEGGALEYRGSDGFDDPSRHAAEHHKKTRLRKYIRDTTKSILTDLPMLEKKARHIQTLINKSSANGDDPRSINPTFNAFSTSAGIDELVGRAFLKGATKEEIAEHAKTVKEQTTAKGVLEKASAKREKALSELREKYLNLTDSSILINFDKEVTAKKFIDDFKDKDQDLEPLYNDFIAATDVRDTAKERYDPIALDRANIRGTALTHQKAVSPVLQSIAFSKEPGVEGLNPEHAAFEVLAVHGHIPTEIWAVAMSRIGYGPGEVFEEQKGNILSSYQDIDSAVPGAHRRLWGIILNGLQTAYKQRAVPDGTGEVVTYKGETRPKVVPTGEEQVAEQSEYGTEGYSRFFQFKKHVAPVPVSWMLERLQAMGASGWFENGVMLFPVTDIAYRKYQKRKGERAESVESIFKGQPHVLAILQKATKDNILRPSYINPLFDENEEYALAVRYTARGNRMFPAMAEGQLEEYFRMLDTKVPTQGFEIYNDLKNGVFTKWRPWNPAADDMILRETNGLNPDDAQVMKFVTLSKLMDTMEQHDDWYESDILRNQIWNLGEQGWGLIHGLIAITQGAGWLAKETGVNAYEAARAKIDGDTDEFDKQWKELEEAYSTAGDTLKTMGLQYAKYLQGYANPVTRRRRFLLDASGVMLDATLPVDIAQLATKIPILTGNLAFKLALRAKATKLKYLRLRAVAKGLPETLFPEATPFKTREAGTLWSTGERGGSSFIDVTSPSLSKKSPSEIARLLDETTRDYQHHVDIIVKTSKSKIKFNETSAAKFSKAPIWTNILKHSIKGFTNFATKPGHGRYLLSRMLTAEQLGGTGVAFVVEDTKATPQISRQNYGFVLESVLNEVGNNKKFGVDGPEQAASFFRDFGEAMADLELKQGKGMPVALHVIVEKAPKRAINRYTRKTIGIGEEGRGWTLYDNATGENFGQFDSVEALDIAFKDPDKASKWGIPDGIDISDELHIGGTSRYTVEEIPEWKKGERTEYEKRFSDIDQDVQRWDEEKKQYVKDAPDFQVRDNKTNKIIGSFDDVSDAYRLVRENSVAEKTSYKISGKDWAEGVAGDEAALKTVNMLMEHRVGKPLSPDMINVNVKDVFGNIVELDAADLGILKPMGTNWEFTPWAFNLFFNSSDDWASLSAKGFDTTHAYSRLSNFVALTEMYPDGVIPAYAADGVTKTFRSVRDVQRIIEEATPGAAIKAKIPEEKINFEKLWLYDETEALHLATGEQLHKLHEKIYDLHWKSIVKSIRKRVGTQSAQKVADYYSAVYGREDGTESMLRMKVVEDLDPQWAFDNKATSRIEIPKNMAGDYVIHIINDKKLKSVHDFRRKEYEPSQKFFKPDANFKFATLRNAIEDVLVHRYNPESLITHTSGNEAAAMSDMAISPLAGERIPLDIRTAKEGGSLTKSQIKRLPEIIQGIKDDGYKIVGEPFLETVDGEYKDYIHIIAEKTSDIDEAVKAGLKTSKAKEKDRAATSASRFQQEAGQKDRPDFAAEVEPVGTVPEPGKHKIQRHWIVNRHGRATAGLKTEPQKFVLYPSTKYDKLHGISLRDAIESNEFFESVARGELPYEKARTIINNSWALSKAPAKVPSVFSGGRFLWGRRVVVTPTKHKNLPAKAHKVDISRDGLMRFIDFLEKEGRTYAVTEPDLFRKGSKLDVLDKPPYFMLPEEYAATYGKLPKAKQYKNIIREALKEGIYEESTKYRTDLGGSVIDNELAVAIITRAGLDVPDFLGRKVNALKFDNAVNIDSNFINVQEAKIIEAEASRYGTTKIEDSLTIKQFAEQLDMDVSSAVGVFDEVIAGGAYRNKRPKDLDSFLKAILGDDIEFRSKAMHVKHRNGKDMHSKSNLLKDNPDKRGFSLIYKNNKLVTMDEYSESMARFIAKTDGLELETAMAGDWLRPIDVLDLKQDPVGRLLAGEGITVDKKALTGAFGHISNEINETAYKAVGNHDPISLAKNSLTQLSAEATAAWSMIMKEGKLPPIADAELLNVLYEANLIEKPTPGHTPKATAIGVLAHLYHVSKKWEFYETLVHRAFMGRMKDGSSPNLRFDWADVVDSMPDGSEAQKISKNVMGHLIDEWKINSTIDDVYLATQEAILDHMVKGGYKSKNTVMNGFSYLKGIWEVALHEHARVSTGHTGAPKGAVMKETPGLTQDDRLLIEGLKQKGYHLHADPFTIMGFTIAELKARTGKIEVLEALLKDGRARYGKAVTKGKDVSPGKLGEWVKFDPAEFFGPLYSSPELKHRYENLYITRQAGDMLNIGKDVADDWHSINLKNLKAINPVDYIISDTSNVPKLVYKLHEVFAQKGLDVIEELVPNASAENKVKLKEALKVGMDEFIDATNSMQKVGFQLSKGLKLLETEARKLNSSDFVSRHKQYVLFWGLWSGATKNAIGNSAVAAVRHPDALMSATYYKGLQLYFGTDNHADPGVIGSLGVLKSLAKKAQENVKVAFGQRGLAKGEILGHLGDPLKEGTAAWLANQLIARDVLAVGMPGEWEMAAPGSVLGGKATGSTTQTFLLTETLRKHILPEIEKGLERIEAGKARFTAEQRAVVLSHMTGASFAKIKGDEALMSKMINEIRKELKKADIDEKTGLEFFGHYLNNVDKALVEFPYKHIPGLKHWPDYNRGLFIVTDDMFKWAYAYYLMVEKNLPIQEIVTEVGRAYADYSRNTSFTHMATGAYPWIKFPMKFVGNMAWAAATNPLLYNVLSKMITPYARAYEFTQDPEARIAYALSAPWERGWQTRNDHGWMTGGWVFDASPSRAHIDVLRSHPLYALMGMGKILTTGGFTSVFGQEIESLSEDALKDDRLAYSERLLELWLGRFSMLHNYWNDKRGNRMNPFITTDALWRLLKESQRQRQPDAGLPSDDFGTNVPWVPMGKHGTEVQSLIRDIFGQPGEYKRGLSPTAQTMPAETWRTLRDKLMLGLGYSQSNVGKYKSHIFESIKDIGRAKKISSKLSWDETYARTPHGGLEQKLEAIARAERGDMPWLPKATGDPELDAWVSSMRTHPGASTGTQSLIGQNLAAAEAMRLSKDKTEEGARQMHSLAPYMFDVMKDPNAPMLNIGGSGLPLNEMNNMAPKEDND